MTNNILIRSAVLADAKVITEIYLASRKIFLMFAPLVHSDESVYQWIKDMLAAQNCIIKVAEKDGHVVGMMVLKKKDNIGWIEQLYVAPQEVGHGIGSQFVNFAKQTLGSPLRLCTFQENVRAQHFYEKHGFQIMQLRDASANEERRPDAVYEWSNFSL